MPKENKTVSQNYLKYCPVISEDNKFETDDNGLVTVFMENKGFFNFLAQKLFKKPRISQIHLEKMGSFIWSQIDGQKNIIDIAESVKEEFGEEAEPLYNRLVTYMKMLENYGFVHMDKKECDK